MAKKVVATLKTSTGKDFAKVIRTVQYVQKRQELTLSKKRLYLLTV